MLRLFLDGHRVAERSLPDDVAIVSPRNVFLGPARFALDYHEMHGYMHQFCLSKVARYENDFVPNPKVVPDENTLVAYDFQPRAYRQIRDLSGNRRTGRLYGVTVESNTATANASKQWDYSDSYHGRFVERSYVEIPDSKDLVELNSDFTVELWADWNASDHSDDAQIAGNDSWKGMSPEINAAGPAGWGLKQVRNEDGKPLLVFSMGESSADDGSWCVLEGPVWMDGAGPSHLAVSRRMNKLSMFLNGKRVAERDVEGLSFGGSPRNVFLGVGQFAQEKLRFRGYIHNFRISDSARYSDEFTPRHGWARDKHTLVCYDFRPEGYRSIKDLSGNDRHGELNGVVLQPAAPEVHELRIVGRLDDMDELRIHADRLTWTHRQGGLPLVTVNGRRWDVKSRPRLAHSVISPLPFVPDFQKTQFAINGKFASGTTTIVTNTHHDHAFLHLHHPAAGAAPFDITLRLFPRDD